MGGGEVRRTVCGVCVIGGRGAGTRESSVHDKYE
jgi:hypothetical protein